MSTEDTGSLPRFSVLLYLFLMPLAFTASLHYMEASHKLLEVRVEQKAKGDMSRFKYLLADSYEVRKHLLFYSPENKYTEISKTNEAFNYTLPVLGHREMKFIKGKEENLFRSATHQQYIVRIANPGHLHDYYRRV